MSEDHASKAKSLLKASQQYRRASQDPNAAGSNIRARWARHADTLLAEAQVHAALAAPAVPEGGSESSPVPSPERGE